MNRFKFKNEAFQIIIICNKWLIIKARYIVFTLPYLFAQNFLIYYYLICRKRLFAHWTSEGCSILG